MKTVLLSAVVGLTLAGCAAYKPSAEEHAKHHPQAQSMSARADQQMKMMQDMHQKMMAAQTPQERQALMAEHMKAMQGGMSMMCEMGPMMGGQFTQGAMPMPQGTAQQEMMQRCMAMRDMTMRMMMERESTAPK